MRLGVDIEVQFVAFFAQVEAVWLGAHRDHDDVINMIIRVNFGFHDRWLRVPDALDLGQKRRQIEPRYRLQVASGLDRRRQQLLDRGGRVSRFQRSFPDSSRRIEGAQARSRQIPKRPCSRGAFYFFVNFVRWARRPAPCPPSCRRCGHAGALSTLHLLEPPTHAGGA